MEVPTYLNKIYIYKIRTGMPVQYNEIQIAKLTLPPSNSYDLIEVDTGTRAYNEQ